LNIDEKSLKILDAFEDTEYKKQTVTVRSKNKSYKALTYIWTDPESRLKGSWDKKIFKEKHLDPYINKKLPSFLKKL